MAEKPITIKITDDRTVDALEIPISESNERWCEYRLEDGSLLKIKPAVESIVRVPSEFDPEGNPIYLVKSTLSMVISDVPDRLKKQSGRS